MDNESGDVFIKKMVLNKDEYLFIRCYDPNEVVGLVKAIEECMPDDHQRVVIHVGALDFLKVEIS